MFILALASRCAEPHASSGEARRACTGSFQLRRPCFLAPAPSAFLLGMCLDGPTCNSDVWDGAPLAPLPGFSRAVLEAAVRSGDPPQAFREQKSLGLTHKPARCPFLMCGQLPTAGRSVVASSPPQKETVWRHAVPPRGPSHRCPGVQRSLRRWPRASGTHVVERQAPNRLIP